MHKSKKIYTTINNQAIKQSSNKLTNSGPYSPCPHHRHHQMKTRRPSTSLEHAAPYAARSSAQSLPALPPAPSSTISRSRS